MWRDWSQTEFWTLLQAGLAGRAAQKKMKEEGKTASGSKKPHIASPDVVVDHDNQEIRMYLHGLMDDAIQATRLAISKDGVNFRSRPEVLSAPYLRVFQHQGHTYGLAMPGLLYRSKDGLTGFEARTKPVADINMRHHALLRQGNKLHVFWTRVGDVPERIFVSSMDISSEDWSDWQLTEPVDVLAPETAWEGGNLPFEPSMRSEITVPARQLRDPFVFQDEDKLYLLYAASGENSIAIAELSQNN